MDENAILERARRLVEAGRSDEAVQQLELVASHQPTDIRVWQALGTAAAYAGRRELAERAAATARLIGSEDPTDYERLAGLFSTLDDPVGALDCMHRALRLTSDTHVLARLNGSIGHVYRRLGRPDDAYRHYEIALQLAPDLPETHDHLGRAAFEAGDGWESVRCFRRLFVTSRNFGREIHETMAAR